MADDILETLNLPTNPVGLKIKITVETTEGNFRTFIVNINEFRLEPTYIEIHISTRSIKGVRFDRLLCRIAEGKIVGNWLALAQIPTPIEDDWIKSWKLIRFEIIT